MAPTLEPAPPSSAPCYVKSPRAHPYNPLSADEIKYASSILETQWAQNTDIQYKVITLQEPPKKEVLPYLDAEARGASLPFIARKAFISYYPRKTNKLHEAIIDLGEGRVERNVRLGKNVHGSGDAEEIMAMERIALEDEGVKRAIEKLQLPQGAVLVCDPWIYGTYLTRIIRRLVPP